MADTSAAEAMFIAAAEKATVDAEYMHRFRFGTATETIPVEGGTIPTMAGFLAQLQVDLTGLPARMNTAESNITALKARNAKQKSVFDYGAVGNGTTSDAAAITAAEAAVAAGGGGTLQFPSAIGFNSDPVISVGAVAREYFGPKTPVNAYGEVDNYGIAARLFRYSDGTDHVGKAGYTLFVESRPKGSGDPTVPGSDFGLGVSIVKKNWTNSQVMGQACAIDVMTRNGHFLSPRAIASISKSNPAVVTTTTNHGYANGDIVVIQNVGGMFQIEDIPKFTIANVTATTFQLVGVNSTSFANFTSGGIVHKQSGDPFLYSPGDTAGFVSNSVQSSACNFSAILEGVAYYMPSGAQIYGTRGIRVQLGAIKRSENLAIGVLAVAENGNCGAAFQAQNSRPSGLEASWDSLMSYQLNLGAGVYEAFRINQLGNVILHGGPTATTPKKMLRANSTNGQFEIVNDSMSASIFQVNDGGTVNIPAGQTYNVGGVRVLGAGIGAWNAPSGGNISRGTFNSATTNLQETNAFVAAIITDLRAQGIIKT